MQITPALGIDIGGSGIKGAIEGIAAEEPSSAGTSHGSQIA